MLLSGIIQTTSTVITLMSQPDAINKGARGIDENLPITVQHSVYAAIDPNIHFKGKSLQDKVAIITGASRGIGADIAIHLAKAGARVAIISRTPEALEETNQAILKVEPNAQVLKCAVDVTDYAASEAAVKEVIGKFGRLDILVANAGVTTPVGVSIDDKDPELWWRTFEVNIRGVFNFAKPSIPYLRQTSGYAIVLSSGAAQVRMPGASDYGISKHAVNRLVEYIDLENPSIKSFALHPGRIPTGLAIDAKIDSLASLLDKTDLPAATVLYLVTGNADWLSGRYVNSNWDLSEVERDWKDKIVSTGALVNKLRIP